MVRRDPGDFLEFAIAYRDQMRRTAYLLCGDWERAADVTQEALIRLYVAWPRLTSDTGLRSYARKAVASAAIDFSRKMTNQELPGAEPVERVTADAAGSVADRLLLVQALAQLPARQRACVVLRYYEDLSIEEVAGVLGCRTGTVKSQTARGLTALRAAYAAVGGELVVDEQAGARTW